MCVVWHTVGHVNDWLWSYCTDIKGKGFTSSSKRGSKVFYWGAISRGWFLYSVTRPAVQKP